MVEIVHDCLILHAEKAEPEVDSDYVSVVGDELTQTCLILIKQ